MKEDIFTLIVYLNKAVAFISIPVFNLATLHGRAILSTVFIQQNNFYVPYITYLSIIKKRQQLS